MTGAVLETVVAPFPLPPHWKWTELRKVSQKTEQINPKTIGAEPLNYVDVSAVSREHLRIESHEPITASNAPSRARKVMRAGDVLFATVRPTLRRVASVPSELDGHICSTAFCVVRAKPDVADPSFLYFAASWQWFVDAVAERQRGSGYPAVTDNDVLQEFVPLPPLAEQRAIVKALRAIQQAVEVRRHEAELEHERKAALIQHLFTHGTGSEVEAETAIGTLPASWRVVRMGEVAELLSGGTPSKDRADWWKGDMPWVSPKDMKQPRLYDAADHVTEEAVREGSRLVPAGTVFIVVRGMILAKDVPVALAEVPMAFNQDMKAIRPREGLDPAYLLYVLQWSKSRLTSHIGSSAHGTRRIGTSSLLDLQLPLPPLIEQQQIAKTLMASEERAKLLHREAEVLDELFRASLEELMTGRLSAVPLIEHGETP